MSDSAIFTTFETSNASLTRDRVLIGVTAYNEEQNIARLLRSLQAQTASATISRIVVIASACTDRTVDIAKTFAKHDTRISIIEQDQRLGKVSAINQLLELAAEEIVVLSCADLELQHDTLEHLLNPLANDSVGCVAAHPVPLNPPNNFLGFAASLMWELHHRVSLGAPKMGELMAFRNILPQIQIGVLADEVAIERGVVEAGFEVMYAPKAIVRNMGATTFKDFLRQRQRWIAANLESQDTFHYPVSTLSFGRVAKAAFIYFLQVRPRVDWFVAAALIELYCRLRALISFRLFKRRSKYQVWDPLKTTKELASHSNMS